MLDPAKMLERFGAHGRAIAASKQRNAVIVTGHELIASELLKADERKAAEDAKQARADARAANRVEKAVLQADKAVKRPTKKAKIIGKPAPAAARAGAKRKRAIAASDIEDTTDEDKAPSGDDSDAYEGLRDDEDSDGELSDGSA